MSTVHEHWLELIKNHPVLAYKRRDFYRNVVNVAQALVQATDFGTRTATPGHSWLKAVCAISQSTLDRALRVLRKLGFLGIVAHGRKAEYTPLSSIPFARWGDGESRVADRSVYVLCEPLTEAELAEYGEQEAERMENKGSLADLFSRFQRAVDVNDTPIPQAPKRNPKHRMEWASPTLKSYFKALSERFQDSGADRTEVHWPGNRTTEATDEASARRNRLNAARTVQFHAPVLQSKGSQYIANILTPFFRNGWTANDVLHALDYRADGTRWSHDGAYGVKNVGAWLNHRLNGWRTNGIVMHSHSQRVTYRAEEARERALRVARAKAAPVASEAARESHSQGIAMLRAALRNGRTQES